MGDYWGGGVGLVINKSTIRPLLPPFLISTILAIRDLPFAGLHHQSLQLGMGVVEREIL
jgi:hypothetical protein